VALEDVSAEDLACAPAASAEKRGVGVFFSFLCAWIPLTISRSTVFLQCWGTLGSCIYLGWFSVILS